MENNKSTKKWFTSDFHFDHQKVIDHCCRPFATTHDMNDQLIAIWNATVGKDDVVFYLGDFTVKSHKSKEYVRQLNGRKVMIPGNHDGCFDFKPKAPRDIGCVRATRERHRKMCDMYLQDGWESIHQELELKLKDGTVVLLSHLPYAPLEGSGDDVRYLDYRPQQKWVNDIHGKPYKQFHLHGHTHGRYIKYRNQIDVGIDGCLELYSEDQIIKMIHENEYIIPGFLLNWYKEMDERKRLEAERVKMEEDGYALSESGLWINTAG
jgi:calcineurin-like phosphoesterase family protein